jgi:uncharacterized protein (DUF3084 family)
METATLGRSTQVSGRASASPRDTDLGYIRNRISALTTRINNTADAAQSIISRVHNEGATLQAGQMAMVSKEGVLANLHMDLDALEEAVSRLDEKVERLQTIG